MERRGRGVRNRSRALVFAAGCVLTAGYLLVGSVGRAEELDCMIQPWREVDLSAPIEAVVEEMLVDRGDQVAEGQVVARLESSVEKATVEVAWARARSQGRISNAEAQMEFAEQSLQRQVGLKEQKVVSESQMDEAVSIHRAAAASLLLAREENEVLGLELHRAEAALERRTIESPVRGVVVERILDPGEYADPPQLLRLAQIDPLRVEVFVPLALYGRIENGMQAEVIPEEPIGGVHAVTVVVVDQVIDAASGTFGVRLELPNPDHALPAGVSCRVRFNLAPGSLAENPATITDAPELELQQE